MRYVEEDNELEIVVGQIGDMKEEVRLFEYAKERMWTFSSSEEYRQIVDAWAKDGWKEAVIGDCFNSGYDFFKKDFPGKIRRCRFLGNKRQTWRDRPSML